MEAEGVERDRAESDPRSWSEDDIFEEAERTIAEAGANAKAETEAV